MKPKLNYDDQKRELEPRWSIAFRAAFLVVRADNRLVGMDRLRDPIIERATWQSFSIDPPACPIIARIAVRDSVTAKVIDNLLEIAESAARGALHQFAMKEAAA